MPKDEDRGERARKRKEERYQTARRAVKDAIDEATRLADPNPPIKRDGTQKEPRQIQLAVQLGLDQSLLSEVRKKTKQDADSGREPSLGLLLLLADYLGRSVDSILGLPVHLDATQIESLIRQLGAESAGRLYRALHSTLFGEDTIERVSAVTAPTLPPPQLPPKPKQSSSLSDTHTRKATKRKRNRKSTE